MKTIRAIATTLLVAGLTFGTMGSALAAKGGNGGRDSGSTQAATSATLNYECDTTVCSAGDVVYFWGEGYDAVQGKALMQIGASLWSNVAVADDGSVEFHWNFFTIPGQYTVQLYQNGKGNKLELKSEVIVTIQ